MVTVRYYVNKESLLDLQRLYDVFIYDARDGQYLKGLSTTFQSLQRSKSKTEVFKLYDELFQASTIVEFQSIVRKTNLLLTILINKYGDFTNDPEFLRVDPLDEILLLDLIDSIVALEG